MPSDPQVSALSEALPVSSAAPRVVLGGGFCGVGHKSPCHGTPLVQIPGMYGSPAWLTVRGNCSHAAVSEPRGP